MSVLQMALNRSLVAFQKVCGNIAVILMILSFCYFVGGNNRPCLRGHIPIYGTHVDRLWLALHASEDNLCSRQ